VFLAGRNMGRQEVEGHWNAEKLRAAEQIARQERDYATQLSAVQAQTMADRDELARLRAVPHPRLLCHAATGVPAVPAGPGRATPEPGALSPGVEFDPTDGLYGLADEADDAVADCRAALATWPKG
jgi:hypothetical protein